MISFSPNEIVPAFAGELLFYSIPPDKTQFFLLSLSILFGGTPLQSDEKL
jgi:hypothetical protein